MMSGREVCADRRRPTGQEHVETVVIGGGQTGLTVGYHLAQRDQRFVILDANERISDSWRQRWDSLRLFTPARFNGLPGWPFPARSWSFPTRDEMADYLQTYAARCDFPIQSGFRVDRLSKAATDISSPQETCELRPTTSWWQWPAINVRSCRSSLRNWTPESSS